MKELTIEQLKSLKIGDWVWIEYPPLNNGEYVRLDLPSSRDKLYFTVNYGEYGYPYSDYGKEWIAYKNKEQAESEYDSLAVENEVLKRDMENLERTIEEISAALYDANIIIDSDGNIHDSRVEDAKRQAVNEFAENIKENFEEIFDLAVKKLGKCLRIYQSTR
ncbi:MAG: hypothetical protein OSJ67_07255 [Clostridia bacterium]|nr:hypothetical protein [Clostridia bacterium]